MFPDLMVLPMRQELTQLGIAEARTAEEVDRAVAQPGTTMVVVNSVCGCAAGKMRPAVRMALANATRPDHMVTVFAGQDRDATERARQHFGEIAPSSPSIAILREGKVTFFMPRYMIESRNAEAIATDLVAAFDEHCAPVLQ